MFTILDEVTVYHRIGIIKNVIYEMVDSKETDNVYAYEIEIDGKIFIVPPEDIETECY